jgi:Heavy metal binding domain
VRLVHRPISAVPIPLVPSERLNESSTMKIQRIIAHVELDALVSFCVVVFFTGCATEPPPLPPNNAADPQLRSPARTPRNLLASDETTFAIERQLSATARYAESAEKMGHDVGKMSGMSEPLEEKTEQTKPAAKIYTCPMHPQVRSDKPGNCADCGMDLVPKKEGGHEAH